MIYELKLFTKEYNELDELVSGYILLHLTEGVRFYAHGYKLTKDELANIVVDAANLISVVEQQCAVGRKAFEEQIVSYVSQIPPSMITENPTLTINPVNVQGYYEELP